jgi:hypothetical protein
VRVRQGRLAGTFTDCRTDNVYPLEFERPTEADLSFFGNNPAIMSWFNGHFERRRDGLVFVANGDFGR